MTALALPLPATDRDALRFRVQRLAADRPGVYRMIDAGGRILYVGKARALRTRLLSYFRATYPDDKAARILHAAADIQFEYTHSEFAAALTELTLIRKHRPPYNVAMNRTRRQVFLVLTDEAYPRLLTTTTPEAPAGLRYGPFRSPTRTAEAARVLSDLLGLRDCRLALRGVEGVQGDLFTPPVRAACPRADFGTCLAPCARPDQAAYAERAGLAAAFCDGRSVAPFGRIIAEMTRHADLGHYDAAIRWREKFETLEWLLAAGSRARAAMELLTFAWRDPGTHGDDRIYLIRHGEVRACYPDPVSPLEREAFAAVVRDELARPVTPEANLSMEQWLQRLLVLSWFRNHPDSWRRTTPLTVWGDA